MFKIKTKIVKSYRNNKDREKISKNKKIKKYSFGNYYKSLKQINYKLANLCLAWKEHHLTKHNQISFFNECIYKYNYIIMLSFYMLSQVNIILNRCLRTYLSSSPNIDLPTRFKKLQVRPVQLRASLTIKMGNSQLDKVSFSRKLKTFSHMLLRQFRTTTDQLTNKVSI